VLNGSYYVKVDSTDPYGVTNTVTQVVTVNRHLAEVQVDIFNEAGEVVRHLTSYVEDTGTFNIENVSLSASVLQPTSDATPVPGNTNYVTINLGNGETLTWDGTDDQGAIVTNGHYDVEIHYEDGTGGDQVITRGLLVESTGHTHPNDSVYAKPNLMNRRTGFQTTLAVDSADTYTLQVKVYDMSGELLRNVGITPDGVNQVRADFTGEATGMYFAMVELINTEGGVAKRQALKIVVVR
jgi:flagellar hook assembly protein FlgD